MDLYFRFRHVFDRTAKQDDIFAMVAQPVIDKWDLYYIRNREFSKLLLCSVIAGYNGTIFAYGQV